MFIREPIRVPPEASVKFEVKYHKGYKPFPTLKAAKAFATEARAEDKGWAEINQVITLPVEGRDVPQPVVYKFDAEDSE